ncbi:MAG TPA: AAA family ATPase [Gammaproteobacteria bacterium]|jgi:type II secretory pathway predicted ATPase ExeA
MYEKFYHLDRSPFSLLPDPAFLFLSRKHAMALTLLKYSLMSKHPFTVIAGEVGAGKTTLVNRLLDDLDDRHTVGLINFTDPGVTQLWPWILHAFGLGHSKRSVVEMYDDFLTFLCAGYERERTFVLIVDEAQNLGPTALENLRMLSNVNARETLLQLILVGQPEFCETLKRPDFRQLNQRISVFYRLNPLSKNETQAYIDHRLGVAGGRPGTFSAKAISLIWAESDGIARRINTLCDLALVYGFASNKPIIEGDLVSEMLADRRDLAVETEMPSEIPATSARPRAVHDQRRH